MSNTDNDDISDKELIEILEEQDWKSPNDDGYFEIAVNIGWRYYENKGWIFE